jgi:hypothetical protein
MAAWMGFFKKKSNWEQTFRIQNSPGTVRNFLGLLFWVWGVGGLVGVGGSFAGLVGAVGVGTSSYLSAAGLLWIGGMVLFGMGALLSHNDMSGERPIDGAVGDIRITR